MSEPNPVAGGHKVRCHAYSLTMLYYLPAFHRLRQTASALHNPNVSDGAKENSCQVGEEIQGPGTVHDDGTAEPSSRSDAGSKDENRVLGGYKATLKSMFLLGIGMVK